MNISLETLRLIAYQYRSTTKEQTEIANKQALRSQKLDLKYKHLISNDPLLLSPN